MATSYVWTTNRYPANWTEFAARNERINNPTQEPVTPHATDPVKQPEPTAIVFRRGDLVALRSGGPVMTLNRIDDDNDVECVWFAENGEIRQLFNVNCAVLVHYTGE